MGPETGVFPTGKDQWSEVLWNKNKNKWSEVLWDGDGVNPPPPFPSGGQTKNITFRHPSNAGGNSRRRCSVCLYVEEHLKTK